jgi:hypothetical protein
MWCMDAHASQLLLIIGNAVKGGNFATLSLYEKFVYALCKADTCALQSRITINHSFQWIQAHLVL